MSTVYQRLWADAADLATAATQWARLGLSRRDGDRFSAIGRYVLENIRDDDEEPADLSWWISRGALPCGTDSYEISTDDPDNVATGIVWDSGEWRLFGTGIVLRHIQTRGHVRALAKALNIELGEP